MEGIVTFYNSSKQYGFIKTDGEDHYFRGSDVQGLKILRTGDKVAFASTPAGPRDKNPKVVQIMLVCWRRRNLDSGGCEQNLGLPRGSSYIRTNREFGPSSFTSNTVNVPDRLLGSLAIRQRIHSTVTVDESIVERYR